MPTMIFGWDVSTSVIGVSVLDLETEKLIGYKVIKLGKADTMFKKYNLAREQMNSFLSEYRKEKNIHYVEEPLMGFTFGKTSKNTLMKLAAMNAVISCFLHDIDPDCVKHIAPVSAKKTIGLKVEKSDGKDAKKKAAAKYALEREPSLPIKYTPSGELSGGVGDLADSYILAKAGALIEKKGEQTIGKEKKNKKSRKNSG